MYFAHMLELHFASATRRHEMAMPTAAAAPASLVHLIALILLLLRLLMSSLCAAAALWQIMGIVLTGPVYTTTVFQIKTEETE